MDEEINMDEGVNAMEISDNLSNTESMGFPLICLREDVWLNSSFRG